MDFREEYYTNRKIQSLKKHTIPSIKDYCKRQNLTEGDLILGIEPILDSALVTLQEVIDV